MAWCLSAYRSDSHAYWADWLTTGFDAYDWHRLELPGRHFRWRIRGNPLSWLDALPDAPPELIVATSMVDLATLRGLHPGLARAVTLYYFHENQFAYPQGEGQTRSLDPQMVQLYGALAADRCLFNSRYNHDSFLAGIDALLEALPDRVPDGVSRRIAAKSSVLPVPVKAIDAAGTRDHRLILWNHRWEYDKDPDLFAAAVIELAERGVEFELALLGPRPARVPAALGRLRERIPHLIRYDCRADAQLYRQVLAEAGIVVSTAIHEFQGLAVLEAVSAGAIPVVPDALCYVEQYPPAYRYRAGDAAAFAERLAACLETPDEPRVDLGAWTGDALQNQWKQALAI